MFMLLPMLLSDLVAHSRELCRQMDFNFTDPSVHTQTDDSSPEPDECVCTATLYKLWKDSAPRCAAKKRLMEATKACHMDDTLKKNFLDTVAACPCMKNEFNFNDPDVHARKNDVCTCPAVGYKMWKTAPNCEKDKLTETVKFCGGLMSEALKNNFTDTADACHRSTCKKYDFDFANASMHLIKEDPCYCAAWRYKEWKDAAPPCTKKNKLMDAVRECSGHGTEMDKGLIQNFTETASSCPCLKSEFDFDEPTRHLAKGGACSCAAFAYHQWKKAPHCTAKNQLSAAVISCGIMMDSALKKNFTDTAAACPCEIDDFNFHAPSSHRNDTCSCAAFGYSIWKNAPHCTKKDKLIETVAYCNASMSKELKQNLTAAAAACERNHFVCTEDNFNFKNVSVHISESDPCHCAALAYNQWKAGPHCAAKEKLSIAVQFCDSTMDSALKENFTKAVESCLCKMDDFNFHDPDAHSNDPCYCAGLGYRVWKAGPRCSEKDRLVATVKFCGETMDKALKKNFTDSASACVCRMTDFKFQNVNIHLAKDDPCQCAAEKYTQWQNADPHCHQKDALLGAADACRQLKMELDDKLAKNFTQTAAACFCRKKDFNFNNASVHIIQADSCYCAAEAYMLWKRAPDCAEKDALINAPSACKAMDMELDEELERNFTITANECASSNTK